MPRSEMNWVRPSSSQTDLFTGLSSVTNQPTGKPDSNGTQSRGFGRTVASGTNSPPVRSRPNRKENSLCLCGVAACGYQGSTKCLRLKPRLRNAAWTRLCSEIIWRQTKLAIQRVSPAEDTTPFQFSDFAIALPMGVSHLIKIRYTGYVRDSLRRSPTWTGGWAAPPEPSTETGRGLRPLTAWPVFKTLPYSRVPVVETDEE